MFTEHLSPSGRLEALDYENLVLIHTESGAFDAFGGSFGFAVEPNDGVPWRTGFRGL